MAKEKKMSLLSWLLILFGLSMLNMFGGVFSGACIVIGVVMMIECRWPEKWGDANA